MSGDEIAKLKTIDVAEQTIWFDDGTPMAIPDGVTAAEALPDHRRPEAWILTCKRLGRECRVEKGEDDFFVRVRLASVQERPEPMRR